MSTNDTPRSQLAQDIAALYATLPGVVAISLGGSLVGGHGDASSDIDLEVFYATPPSVPLRRAIIEPRAASMEVAHHFFGEGDEWIEQDSGQRIDVTLFHTDWMAEQMARVLVQHQPSLGYTTCFWYTLLHAVPLADGSGWLANQQHMAAQPYPEPLRVAIIRHNLPVLRQNQSSFLHQIDLALQRNDPISINHRVAAFLASYFDIIFALNRLPHPGEKQLLTLMQRDCALIPTAASEDLAQAIRGVSAPHDLQLLVVLNCIVDRLEEIVSQSGV